MPNFLFSIFHFQAHGLWDVVLRSSCVYLFLLVVLRVLGKKRVGQSELYDLVLLLVVANAVQNSMIGENTTLLSGIVASGTVIAWDALLNFSATHWRKLDYLVTGIPTTIVQDGVLNKRSMKKEGLEMNDLEAALRKHGVSDYTRCKLVVLETDGEFSVILKD